jgi:hypothetical protein
VQELGTSPLLVETESGSRFVRLHSDNKCIPFWEYFLCRFSEITVFL